MPVDDHAAPPVGIVFELLAPEVVIGHVVPAGFLSVEDAVAVLVHGCEELGELDLVMNAEDGQDLGLVADVGEGDSEAWLVTCAKCT